MNMPNNAYMNMPNNPYASAIEWLEEEINENLKICIASHRESGNVARLEASTAQLAIFESAIALMLRKAYKEWEAPDYLDDAKLIAAWRNGLAPSLVD